MDTELEKKLNIIELTELIETTNDESSPFNQSLLYDTTDATVYPPPSVANGEPDAKKRKRKEEDSAGVANVNDTSHALYTSRVLSNKHVNKTQDRVKKECEELVDLCDKVKLWVSLTMPKIEDGDNFGVQIQEEVLSELHRSQESGYNLRDNARSNHLNRAKICSKLIKYPFVEDYTIALKEHDAKQLYMARQHLVDIKNIYAVLTDVIHKNFQKIRSPKGNNREGMY
ncbi:hypothetical protein M422DRAFT_46118 [Sphaerobolus stellatus SS14]|nr:hypothetical protein M422DRAFT_46118 [Sphaerobolus stellatus SS14]